MNSRNTQVLALITLAAVCLIWGTTYLVLRIGVGSFPAFLFSGLRMILAGGILILTLRLFKKIPFPDWPVIRNQAVAGFFMFTIGNGLVGWAEIYVSSGLAAIISSMVPVWIILLNMLGNPDEQPNFPIAAGLIIGSSGIVMIFGQHLHEFSNPVYQLGIVAMFIANIGWAVGSVWIKRKNQDSNLFMIAGLQMLFGGLFMLPISAVVDDYSKLQISSTFFYALIYLVLIGSIIAYVCFTYSIRHLPMTIVSLYAYINPLVAVLLGWLVASEKFSLSIFIGMLVAMAGVYLVNMGYRHRKEWQAEFSEGN